MINVNQVISHHYFKQISPEARAAQSAYISKNENPLGAKYLLQKPAKAPRHTMTHKKYHPISRSTSKTMITTIFSSSNRKLVKSSIQSTKKLIMAHHLLTGHCEPQTSPKLFMRQKMNTSGSVAFIDYDNYFPSYDDPAGFIAAQVMNGNELSSILIFQFSVKGLNYIINNKNGLSETSEFLLIGPDKLLRADSTTWRP